MSEHRVSVLSTSLRRYEDPARSRDPRVRAVLAALPGLQIAPAPRAHFRAELRAQLVAVTPRLVADGVAAEQPMVEIVAAARAGARRGSGSRLRPKHVDGPGLLGGLRAVPIARPLGVVASLVVVFALLLAGAVWLSQKALPGDSLYGLKRASESWQLDLASGDTERAQDYLRFASRRAGEVQDLLSRSSVSAAGAGTLADSAVNPQTRQLITSALASSDSDVKSAAQLLNGRAVQNDSAHPLQAMTSWAPVQLERLDAIAAAMPAGALRTRTTSSADLVHTALTRAKTLASKVGCTCLDNADTDSLGPVPCGVCPAPADRTVSPHAVQPTGAARGTGHQDTQGPPNSAGPAAQTADQPAPQNPEPAATSGAPAPTSTQQLPTLPINLPHPSKAPVSVHVGTCVSVDLGPIQIGLGLSTCGVKVSLDN